MDKFKKTYLDGWRALSYCLVLGLLLLITHGLVQFLAAIFYHTLSYADLVGDDKSVRTTIEVTIGTVAFLIYAPLIAYYHHQWDGDNDSRTLKHEESR